MMAIEPVSPNAIADRQQEAQTGTNSPSSPYSRYVASPLARTCGALVYFKDSATGRQFKHSPWLKAAAGTACLVSAYLAANALRSTELPLQNTFSKGASDNVAPEPEDFCAGIEFPETYQAFETGFAQKITLSPSMFLYQASGPLIDKISGCVNSCVNESWKSPSCANLKDAYAKFCADLTAQGIQDTFNKKASDPDHPAVKAFTFQMQYNDFIKG